MSNELAQKEEFIKADDSLTGTLPIFPAGQFGTPLAPKAAAIAAEKERFISNLRENGGNVSKALAASGLRRNTAYKHSH